MWSTKPEIKVSILETLTLRVNRTIEKSCQVNESSLHIFVEQRAVWNGVCMYIYRSFWTQKSKCDLMIYLLRAFWARRWPAAFGFIPVWIDWKIKNEQQLKKAAAAAAQRRLGKVQTCQGRNVPVHGPWKTHELNYETAYPARSDMSRSSNPTLKVRIIVIRGEKRRGLLPPFPFFLSSSKCSALLCVLSRGGVSTNAV